MVSVVVTWHGARLDDFWELSLVHILKYRSSLPPPPHSPFPRLLDWLNNVLHRISAIFHPCNGGDYKLKVITCKVWSFDPWRTSLLFEKNRETVFCVPRGLLSLPRGDVPSDGHTLTSKKLYHGIFNIYVNMSFTKMYTSFTLFKHRDSVQKCTTTSTITKILTTFWGVADLLACG